MSTNGGPSAVGDPWADHRQFVRTLEPLAPIGNVALMGQLQWKQPGRFRRVRNTLIGLQVIRFDGGRGASRRLALGDHDFETALANALDVHVGRETALYRLLTAPIDDMVTQFHLEQDHPVHSNANGDGVTPHVTAAKSAGNRRGAFTRPDITVIVDLEYPYLGGWHDVHAVEVKPYWALGRDGLFEAAAQAALQRCTHSWLVAYLPPADAPGMDREQRRLIKAAESELREPDGSPGSLTREAEKIGVGIAIAQRLQEDTQLDRLVSPRRQAMEPTAAEQLFQSLSRDPA